MRKAGASRNPVQITDRGQLVAVLGNPAMLKPRLRKRIILPAYAKYMTISPGNDVLADLDAIRGER